MAVSRGFLFGLSILAIAILVVVVSDGGGGGGGGFQSRSTAVCDEVEGELRKLPQSPSSIDQAIELEHSALAVYERGISRLEALGPAANAAFRAGLADDQALVREMASMLARPDFVQLSLTVPKDPSLAPPWLKEWLARSHELQAHAEAQFADAGVPACENLFG